MYLLINVLIFPSWVISDRPLPSHPSHVVTSVSIKGCGPLHVPNWPHIEGIKSFKVICSSIITSTHTKKDKVLLRSGRVSIFVHLNELQFIHEIKDDISILYNKTSAPIKAFEELLPWLKLRQTDRPTNRHRRESKVTLPITSSTSSSGWMVPHGRLDQGLWPEREEGRGHRHRSLSCTGHI